MGKPEPAKVEPAKAPVVVPAPRGATPVADSSETVLEMSAKSARLNMAGLCLVNRRHTIARNDFCCSAIAWVGDADIRVEVAIGALFKPNARIEKRVDDIGDQSK